MPSGFKEALATRWEIIKINARNSYQQETAYFSNNWASLLSTGSYTLTYLLFVHVIFANVQTMAGYSRNDVLFLTLIGQLNFYLLATFSLRNADQMILDVNQGNLDLLLIKPLPSLFYVSLRDINLLALLRDGGVPTLFVLAAIDWPSLHLSPHSILFGTLAFLCGLVTSDAVKFLLSIPVFWKGEAQEFSGLFYSLINYDFPWEGMVPWFRVTMTTLVPVLVGTSLTTSLFLAKSQPGPLLALALVVAAAANLAKSYAWSRALRAYTSASS